LTRNRNTSKSEIKKLKNNANLIQNLSKKGGNKQFGFVGKNMNLRNFSKSYKKSIETMSNHSGVSRKSRLLSASSNGGIDLKEYSKMKFENQRYKFLLSEMMEKFMKFKLSYEKGKGMGVTGESGSSFVWKDRADPSNTKIRHRENSVNDPDMVNFEMENEKDHIIKKLKQKLSQKDRIIEELKKQLTIPQRNN